MRYLWSLLVLAPWLILLAGCAGDIDRFAEREITNRAPELIGPAERYRAEVRGISRANVSCVNLVGIAVRPEPHLEIDPLSLTLRDVHYQLRPFHIIDVANATFAGRVSQAAVNQYARNLHIATSNNIQNVQIEFDHDVVKLSASYPAPGIDIPFSATGRLRVEEGMRVNVEIQDLQVGVKEMHLALGLPKGIGALLLARVNPILDLSGLRFKPRIDHLTIEPGGLEFSGTAFLRDIGR